MKARGHLRYLLASASICGSIQFPAPCSGALLARQAAGEFGIHFFEKP
jgi:hypothetical protein